MTRHVDFLSFLAPIMVTAVQFSCTASHETDSPQLPESSRSIETPIDDRSTIDTTRRSYVLALGDGTRASVSRAQTDFVLALEPYHHLASDSAALGSERRMSRKLWQQRLALMADWNPIGFSKLDVRRLLGEPDREAPYSIQYDFVTPLGGGALRFTIDPSGYVQSVEHLYGG